MIDDHYFTVIFLGVIAETLSLLDIDAARIHLD